MKNKICGLMLMFIMLSCQSQISSPTKNSVESFKTPDYFFGTWKLVARNYQADTVAKSFPLHECMKKYTIVFSQENKAVFLTKNFAGGTNCAVKSSSGKTAVDIANSSFSYADYDLKRTDQFKIDSKNRFSILYREIIEGKMADIEDVYQRE